MNEDFDKKFPSNEYSKTVYDFTREEIRKLQTFEAIAQMGQLAQMMLNNLLQGECLPRVSIKNSPDGGISYDLPKGQFCVYTPRHWCLRCTNRRGTHEYLGKLYCETCAILVKNEKQPPKKGKNQS